MQEFICDFVLPVYHLQLNALNNIKKLDTLSNMKSNIAAVMDALYHLLCNFSRIYYLVFGVLISYCEHLASINLLI